MLGAVEVLWSNIAETEMFQRSRAVRLLRGSKYMLPVSDAAQQSIVFRSELVAQLRDLRRPDRAELSPKVVIVCGDSGAGKSTAIQSAFHRQSGVVQVELLEPMSLAGIASEILRQLRFTRDTLHNNAVNYLKSMLSEIPQVDMYTEKQRIAHLFHGSPTKAIRRYGDALGKIPFSLEDPIVDFGRVKPLVILNISPAADSTPEMLQNAVKLARSLHECGSATVIIECNDSLAIASLLDGPCKLGALYTLAPPHLRTVELYSRFALPSAAEYQDRIQLLWVEPMKEWQMPEIAGGMRSLQTQPHLRALTERLQGPYAPSPVKKGHALPQHPYRALLERLLTGPVSIDQAASGVLQRMDELERDGKDDPWVADVLSFMAQRLGVNDAQSSKKEPFAIGSAPRLAMVREQILTDLVRHDGVLSYRPDTFELRYSNAWVYTAAVSVLQQGKSK